MLQPHLQTEPEVNQTEDEIERNAKRAARAAEIAEKRRRQKELSLNIKTVKKGTGVTSSINDSTRKHAVHQSKGFKTTIKPLGGKGAVAIELNAGDDEFAKYIDPLLNHAGVPS
jgi:predicted ATP-grasp superfamily ATP-dependent carboligase